MHTFTRALVALVAAGVALAGPGTAVGATDGSDPLDREVRADALVAPVLDAWRGMAAAADTPTVAHAASTRSDDDPLGDTVTLDGTATLEPRGDLQRVELDYAERQLEVTATVPGGVDPTSDPSWQEGGSVLGTVFDVNGDDEADFISILAGDGFGGLAVLTINVPAALPPEPDSLATELVPCLGTGSFDPLARTYAMAIPSACLGNAYEIRAGTVLVFNRDPGADELDLTIDVAPDAAPTPVVNRETSRDGTGYRFVAADGGIFSFGSASFLGSTGATQLNRPVNGMEATPSGEGYWLVASDGGIFAFGDARFFGSTGATPLNAPIVGMAATPTAAGYWLVASDGGIFAFGDAGFFGSAGADRASAAVVGMAPTPTGAGYWLVRADGEILPFGDARRLGSAPPVAGTEVVDMAVTPSGSGYWVVRDDGSIDRFGDAAFDGDLAFTPLAQPIVGMSGTPTGRGYWLVAADGGIFSFGDAAFFGSTGATPLNRPIVGMTS